jgi:dipeptidyl aminopeptidase/acylaminoacyl peptidase
MKVGGSITTRWSRAFTTRARRASRALVLVLVLLLAGSSGGRARAAEFVKSTERQVTRGSGGRILTNVGVWSPDSEWIVYDIRSDAAGERFDGTRIEVINVRTGEMRVLYESANGAHCGVATFHPTQPKVLFILGPEHPTGDWSYRPYHRRGVIVDLQAPGVISNLDARDLAPPFTPGALRGGSHVHVWDAAGQWVSFTYEDHLLAQFRTATPANDINLRNVGVSVPRRKVRVSRDHPRNHDGDYFSVVVTRTTANPKPGSDEINRAFEEGWVGRSGYDRADGARQPHALAFQGHVVTEKGETISEVFIVDLPEDLSIAGDGPLEGTANRMPSPPRGVAQRRLTFTQLRKHPGIQGPRHWLRSSPDGSRIAFLMQDEEGVTQLWTISPNGGAPRQMTRNSLPVASAFTWSPNGKWLAHVMDDSVCVTDADSGRTTRLTERGQGRVAPRPEACVFSPDGGKIAFVRQVEEAGRWSNQIFVLCLEP